MALVVAFQHKRDEEHTKPVPGQSSVTFPAPVSASDS